MDGHARITRVGLPAVTASSSASGGDLADSRAAQEAERIARYRLVIEQGAAKGAFIYKILDRETGEVVRQLPREEVAKIGARASYAAGAVIDTEV
ncbi:flagellar protein FlaG [Brevundimonas sp.]|uniref:flagellar protein FlaG n=1 Tax=Brevundimonas sp. TaxID=1871086 RepID=UPI00391D18EB